MRNLLVLVLFTALFVACEDAPESEALSTDPDAPGVTVPAEPEEIVGEAADLVGQWVITEQNGEAPDEVYFVTFTREGEYLLQDEFGTTERSSFRPAGEDLIAVTDSAGTRRLAYDLDALTLTLSEPGTDNTTVLERREGLD